MMDRQLAIGQVLGWAFSADCFNEETTPQVEVDEVLLSLGVAQAEIDECRERET